ncbi:unnamed protein product [Calypogeia fissa]
MRVREGVRVAGTDFGDRLARQIGSVAIVVTGLLLKGRGGAMTGQVTVVRSDWPDRESSFFLAVSSGQSRRLWCRTRKFVRSRNETTRESLSSYGSRRRPGAVQLLGVLHCTSVGH